MSAKLWVLFLVTGCLFASCQKPQDLSGIYPQRGYASTYQEFDSFKVV